ncbi:MAG: hypothetical protein V4710_12325 [Verrucomicrobiota bacterium]
MAVLLQLTYSKKLGLPNYSSHSCSVSITVEITDSGLAAQETAKLYRLLQSAVDNEIKEVGFIPDAATYGAENVKARANLNGNGYRPNGRHANEAGVNDCAPGRNGDQWNCTEGQQGLILRLVNEGNFDKKEVEALAQQLFNVGVKALDKLQASQLIEELLEKSGKKTNGRRPRWQNSSRARS